MPIVPDVVTAPSRLAVQFDPDATGEGPAALTMGRGLSDAEVAIEPP